MNITSPVLTGAIKAAEVSGDQAGPFLRALGAGTGWFSDSPDAGLGIMMSALSGVAAALAVAIALSIYFRGYRSRSEILKHGLAATAVLALVAFVVWDMRHAAQAYLGINPAKPAVEFEIRMPKAALINAAGIQIELLTDRNQKLAKVQEQLEATTDGRSILRGTVTLDYRTTERFVVLQLPGKGEHQGQRQFRLRLPASPTHSAAFGPWHLADGIVPAGGGAVSTEIHDAFSIRYRVL